MVSGEQEFSVGNIFPTPREEPGDLICAHGLLALAGHDHPLNLPATLSGEAWVDFSKLTLVFRGVPDASTTPDLPVDVSPLLRLMNEHPDVSPLLRLMNEHPDEVPANRETRWTYDWFYLELLAREGKLVPLFWGTMRVMAELRTYELPQLYRSGDQDGFEAHQAHCERVWAESAGEWVKQGWIEPHDGRPWLSRLICPKDESHWPVHELPFANRLRFTKVPFYPAYEAREALIAAMKMELWQTSVFSPAPFSKTDRMKWRQMCKRFALDYRRQSHQEVRKSQFEEFVRKQYEKHVPVKTIARQAVAKGLHPFGTKKSPEGADEPIESCRCAVYRVIRRLKRKAERAQRLGTGEEKQNG